MSDNALINILIAEDNDVSREMMAGILKTQGFNTIGAIDGTEAIKIVDSQKIDLALVDINMSPKGGFEFIKHMTSKGMDIPAVIVTGDDSSDILIEANALGVTRVFQKPIDPARLIQTVERTLRKRGHNTQPLSAELYQVTFSPEELMTKAIELAENNAQSKKGGPFGAIVADQEGKILGEGVNGISSRVDPTAHAEVMAIRRAAERLNQTSLSDCVLYCSSQPTKIGMALIESVGIGKVYYGLSYDDIGTIKEHAKTADPVYEQLGRDKALTMFKTAQDV